MDGDQWQKDRKAAEDLLRAVAKCSAVIGRTLSDAELRKARELRGAALVGVAQEIATRGK